MKTCAVVPAYRVKRHINQVVSGLLNYVDEIIVIDDCCPEGSGKYVQAHFTSHTQVTVIFNKTNQGVGGAVIAGYQKATAQGAEILVKVDGDGQMDPAQIPNLIAPITAGEADYTKGNRFFDPEYLKQMPPIRVIGNAGLSFLSKASTGYWHLMDPTNGYTAIHAAILPWLHLERISKRYFFETDLLFRLGAVEAVVQDMPMPAIYGDEVSNLSVKKALFEFSSKHFKNFIKRIFYTYYLRSFSLASILLTLAVPLLLFGLIFGSSQWLESSASGNYASTGTIFLAALPLLLGVQMLLLFFGLDMTRKHSRPLWLRLGRQKKSGATHIHATSEQSRYAEPD